MALATTLLGNKQLFCALLSLDSIADEGRPTNVIIGTQFDKIYPL